MADCFFLYPSLENKVSPFGALKQNLNSPFFVFVHFKLVRHFSSCHWSFVNTNTVLNRLYFIAIVRKYVNIHILRVSFPTRFMIFGVFRSGLSWPEPCASCQNRESRQSTCDKRISKKQNPASNAGSRVLIDSHMLSFLKKVNLIIINFCNNGTLCTKNQIVQFRYHNSWPFC